MDKAIKKVKKKVVAIEKAHKYQHNEAKMQKDLQGTVKGMDKLIRMDKKLDKKCEMREPKKKGKK